jgi:HK97 family phage prohead protease
MRNQLPKMMLRAAFEPASLNEERRTVDLVWTTGARVLRSNWGERFWEELSLDPAHVRMGRLNAGAPLLADHNGRDLRTVLGVVESATLQKGRGVALVRFARAGVDPEADRVFAKVADGVLRNVSVGYRIHKLEKTEESADKIPVFRAVDWEPVEISLVPIGADLGAGVRSEAPETYPVEVITRGSTPQKGRVEMSDKLKTPEGNTDPAQAERTRAAEISRIVTRAGLGGELANELIASGASIDVTRARVLDALATRSDSYGPDQAPSGAPIQDIHGRTVGMGETHDSIEKRIERMSGALAYRAGCGKLDEESRPYARLSLADMARVCLEQAGKSTRLMSQREIIERALSFRGGGHTTSDFTNLLEATTRRTLLDGYTSYQGGIRTISKPSTATDFRAKHAVRLGEAPALEEVQEHAEFKDGSMVESAESYRLKTFGKIFAISRQAIINDDLGAFSLLAKYGRAAASMESDELVKLLSANAGLGVTMADGTVLFHSTRGNIGVAGAISVATLALALKAMRLQKMLGSQIPLNIIPKYLLVPAALEVVAMQHVAEIQAALSSSVNPFASKLEVVVEPRLDAVSAAAWYVAADPMVTPSIEHAYLDSEPGPVILREEGFRVDGACFKVREDFGCGIVATEGIYLTPAP